MGLQEIEEARARHKEAEEQDKLRNKADREAAKVAIGQIGDTPDLEAALVRQLRIIELAQERLGRLALTGKSHLEEISRLSASAARVSAELRQLRDSQAKKAQELPSKQRRIAIAIAIFSELRPEERIELLQRLKEIADAGV